MKKYPSINMGTRLGQEIQERIKLLREGSQIAHGEETAQLLEIDESCLLEALNGILKLLRHQEKVTYDVRSNNIKEQLYDSLTGNYGHLIKAIDKEIDKVRENIYNLRGYYKPEKEKK